MTSRAGIQEDSPHSFFHSSAGLSPSAQISSESSIMATYWKGSHCLLPTCTCFLFATFWVPSDAAQLLNHLLLARDVNVSAVSGNHSEEAGGRSLPCASVPYFSFFAAAAISHCLALHQPCSALLKPSHLSFHLRIRSSNPLATWSMFVFFFQQSFVEGICI